MNLNELLEKQKMMTMEELLREMMSQAQNRLHHQQLLWCFYKRIF